MSRVIAKIAGESLTLIPEKAVIWSDMLWLADIHLGKIRHFRKSGIAVPEKASEQNFENLINIIQSTDCKQILFLGDLFHSHYNDDWESFEQVIHHFNNREFILIPGNHDIINPFRFEKLNIRIIRGHWQAKPFLFSHEPINEKEIPEGMYNICGHIHPTVLLKGKGRQQMSLPCFYFSEYRGYLPAFGIFTGNHRIKAKKEDQIFIIANEKVIRK